MTFRVIIRHKYPIFNMNFLFKLGKSECLIVKMWWLILKSKIGLVNICVTYFFASTLNSSKQESQSKLQYDVIQNLEIDSFQWYICIWFFIKNEKIYHSWWSFNVTKINHALLEEHSITFVSFDHYSLCSLMTWSFIHVILLFQKCLELCLKYQSFNWKTDVINSKKWITYHSLWILFIDTQKCNWCSDNYIMS